jgi:hypothetical protein
MSGKKTKPRKQVGEAKTARGKGTVVLLLEWLLGLATLIGGLAAILTFLPRVSVSQSDPVEPSNPFSASFTITNMNFIPLRAVGASVAVAQLIGAPATMLTNVVADFTTRITRPEWNNHKLAMDQRFTITPAPIFAPADPSVRLGGADLAIVVTKPWILPFARERSFVLLLIVKPTDNSTGIPHH